MISFTILTSDRAALASALRARGLLDEDNSPKAGVEIVVVPNPIVTDPGDPKAAPPVPPTYDTRRCYMVKLAHAAERADDDATVRPPIEDENPRFTRSMIVGFVKANGTPVTLDDGTRGWSFANGKHVLIDPRDQSKFGGWQ